MDTRLKSLFIFIIVLSLTSYSQIPYSNSVSTIYAVKATTVKDSIGIGRYIISATIICDSIGVNDTLFVAFGNDTTQSNRFPLVAASESKTWTYMRYTFVRTWAKSGTIKRRGEVR